VTPSARAALYFASAGHALCHGSKIVLAVQLLSAAAHFGMADTELWPALTAFGFAMGLCSVPGGLLSDRWGPGRTLLLYLWLLAGAGVLCFVAQGWVAFVVAHAALGAASGLYHPPGLALLSFAGRSGERGALMGWHGVLGQAGPIVAPLVVRVVAPGWGWRAPYLVLAAMAALVAIAGHVAVARGRLSLDAPSRPEPPSEGALPRRTLALLVLVMTINAFLLDGFLALFPTTVEKRGIQPVSGMVLHHEYVEALILLLSVLGPALGGRLARGPSATRRYVGVLAAQPLVLLGAAAALDRPQVAFALFAAFALLNYLMQPMENSLLAGYTSGARRGAIYALKFCVGWAVGSTAPWLLLPLIRSGYAQAHGKDAVAYAALGLMAAAGTLGAFLFARRIPRVARG
jgi:MFS family permease